MRCIQEDSSLSTIINHIRPADACIQGFDLTDLWHHGIKVRNCEVANHYHPPLTTGTCASDLLVSVIKKHFFKKDVRNQETVFRKQKRTRKGKEDNGCSYNFAYDTKMVFHPSNPTFLTFGQRPMSIWEHTNMKVELTKKNLRNKNKEKINLNNNFAPFPDHPLQKATNA